MIMVYEGRIGGGKTYHAVQHMAKYLASGGVVATNITLNWPEVVEYCRRRFGKVPVPEQYIHLVDENLSLFHRHTPQGTRESPSLVVIDEAHIWFNSRDWASQSREVLTFLTQSRKCHTDIIFISQSMFNVDKQVIRLVQYVWRFRDMSNWTIPILQVKYPLNQFFSCQLDQDGKTELGRWFKMKDPAIYKLYNTFELLRSFPRLESKPYEVQTVRGYGKVRFIVKMVLLFAVVWTGYRLETKRVDRLLFVREKQVTAKLQTGASTVRSTEAKRETPAQEVPKQILQPLDAGVMIFAGDKLQGAFLDGQYVKVGNECEHGVFLYVNDYAAYFQRGTNVVQRAVKREGENKVRSASMQGTASAIEPRGFDFF